MSIWTTEPAPFSQNHTPLLIGLSSSDGTTPVPVAVDPATGKLSTSASVSISGSAIPIAGATTAIVTAIVDASGNQITSFNGGSVTQGTSPWIVAGGGTAGSAATGVVSVQGIASMTPVQVSQATASNLNAQVVGNVAAAASDSGNPVKVGGVFNTTIPTLTNGQRGDMQFDSRNGLFVTIKAVSGATGANVIAPADGQAGQNGLAVNAETMVFNGATWDRSPGTTLGSYGIIRDAAGNARGVNVTAGNALVVDGSAVTQPVSGTVTANPTTPSTLVAFVTTVTSAGTRVQLASNAVVAGIVQAPSTNTGKIYVGGATVSSTVYGAELQPGQASGIQIDNTNKIYIDASVNGDKCAFFGS